MIHTVVTCSCGRKFALDSYEEEMHYVWAVRSDGSRSNLGECPVKHGSVQAAAQRLARNGHTWVGMGTRYQGERVTNDTKVNEEF